MKILTFNFTKNEQILPKFLHSHSFLMNHTLAEQEIHMPMGTGGTGDLWFTAILEVWILSSKKYIVLFLLVVISADRMLSHQLNNCCKWRRNQPHKLELKQDQIQNCNCVLVVS